MLRTAAISMYKQKHGPSKQWSRNTRYRLEKGPTCPYVDCEKVSYISRFVTISQLVPVH